ncbi:MAG: alpha/beta fold hydrolase [Terrimesophilobacter sp.]
MSAELTGTTCKSYDSLVVWEHTFRVPLDHAAPEGESIELFARELVTVPNQHRELPYLAWFQGGPGNRAERPTAVSGWLKRALEEYRVVLIDQRGTGLSSLINRTTIVDLGDAQQQAEYLAKFRADAIVHDAEQVRRLIAGNKPWSILGQSYGGFIALNYLSFHANGLSEVFITAGLPVVSGNPDDVYTLTYQQTAQRCDEFFATYPGMNDRAWEIFEHLGSVDETLPTGERLTPERFQTLGIQLGTDAGFRQLYFQLESAFVATKYGRRLSDFFLNEISAVVSFAKNPLYALLQEAIYSTGTATAWSAHRVRARFPEFSRERTRTDGAFRFTGEMVFPWQFEQDPALIPLREAAMELANRRGLSELYDPEALGVNEVPVAAAVYYDDMFVPRETSLHTASLVRGIQLIITNDYQHDGIRRDGEQLLDKLIQKVRQ